MKEQSIKNIHTIGKISYIAAVIAKVLVIIGLVVTLLVSVLCFTVFADKFKVDMKSQ